MRILVADDHPLYLESVHIRLTRLFPNAEVVVAPGLNELLEASGRQPLEADLILLDLRMPGMDGSNGIARVREVYPQAVVIIMSGAAGPEDAKSAIRGGARGFMLKTMPAEAFSSAISLVVAGGSYFPTDFLDMESSASNSADSTGPTRQELDEKLTPKERQVLIGLVAGSSNKELGRQLNLAEVTIKLHVRQILRKIGVRNRAGAAAIAARAGLV